MSGRREGWEARRRQAGGWEARGWEASKERRHPACAPFIFGDRARPRRQRPPEHARLTRGHHTLAASEIVPYAGARSQVHPHLAKGASRRVRVRDEVDSIDAHDLDPAPSREKRQAGTAGR